MSPPLRMASALPIHLEHETPSGMTSCLPETMKSLFSALSPQLLFSSLMCTPPRRGPPCTRPRISARRWRSMRPPTAPSPAFPASRSHRRDGFGRPVTRGARPQRTSTTTWCSAQAPTTAPPGGKCSPSILTPGGPSAVSTPSCGSPRMADCFFLGPDGKRTARH